MVWSKLDRLVFYRSTFSGRLYRFHGLPGLIVELYDEQNDYHFNLVRSENLKLASKNQFLEMTKQMGVLVDWDKYKKAKLAYYESPVSFIKMLQEM